MRATPSIISMAPTGQIPAHNWQPMHLSGITSASSIPFLFPAISLL